MTTEYSIRFSSHTTEPLHALKEHIEEGRCPLIDVFAIHDEKRPYWFLGTAFDDEEMIYAGRDGVFSGLAKQFPKVEQKISFQNGQGCGILTSSFERRVKCPRRDDDLSAATEEMFTCAGAGPLKTHDIRRFLKNKASLNGTVEGHGFLWKLASGVNGSLIPYCAKLGMSALGPNDDPVVIAKAVLEFGNRALRKQIADLVIGEVAPYKSPLSLMNDAVKSNDIYAAAGSLLLGLNVPAYIEGHPDSATWINRL